MAKIQAGLIVLGLLGAAANARAQAGRDTAAVMSWLQIVDGREEAWPRGVEAKANGVEAASNLLNWYRQDGYYAAEIESLAVTNGEGRIWIEPGNQVKVGQVEISGITSLDRETVLGQFETRPGSVLREDVLERDLDRLLRSYDEAGLVLASAEVAWIGPLDDDSTRLQVVVHVTEGDQLSLQEIQLPDGVRTQPEFIERATGLDVGQSLAGYDPVEIQSRLEATGLFAQVDSVRLAVDADRNAVMRLALTEGPPGSFDALVGYLPNTGPEGGGTVVGDVNILLRHVLGGGRSFGFRFQRNPGSITRVNLHMEDPYILGLPLRLAARFDGLQQDSTFDTRSFGLDAGYYVQSVELLGNLSRELSRPGSAQLSSVPPSDSWFAGFGFSYRSVDSPVLPGKGFEITSNVENGQKRRELTRPTDEGTERVVETISQQRLRGRARLFVPVRRRNVVAFGIDSQAIQSRSYDEADLIRFGGANSMRGYNEDQFRGNLTVRALTEWRFLMDRTSYLFGFVDLGYVNVPEINTDSPAGQVTEEWLTGYGMGIQLGTQAGLFTMSLAFNGDEGLDAKVHLGMVLGL